MSRRRCIVVVEQTCNVRSTTLHRVTEVRQSSHYYWTFHIPKLCSAPSKSKHSFSSSVAISTSAFGRNKLVISRPSSIGQSSSSYLKITNHSFRFASPHLWNQLPLISSVYLSVSFTFIVFHSWQFMYIIIIIFTLLNSSFRSQFKTSQIFPTMYP